MSVVKRLGRYSLGHTLGTGGMASVYLGELSGVGGFRRKVAIKVLHPHLRGDPKIVEGFLREARLAAHLRHERIVPVIDVGEEDGRVFLVMDYIEGVSLAALIETLPEAERRRLGLRALLDALEGLHAAHALEGDDGEPLGLVHRDFTPNNILVDQSGVARLADFGIARTQRGPVLTTRPLVKGTLPYLAPEQVRGHALDRRTDVWAAGAIAFEILTGQSPFDLGGDPAFTLAKIAAGDHPALGELAPDLSPTLVDAVTWALTLEPAERCPDADALRRALAEAPEAPALVPRSAVAAAVRAASAHAPLGTATTSPESGEPSSASRLRSPGRRSYVVAGMAAVVGLAVLLATLTSAGPEVSIEARPLPTRESPAVAPEVRETSDSHSAWSHVDGVSVAREPGVEQVVVPSRGAERIEVESTEGHRGLSDGSPALLAPEPPTRRRPPTKAPQPELAENPYAR